MVCSAVIMVRPDGLRGLFLPEKFSDGAREEQGSCQG